YLGYVQWCAAASGNPHLQALVSMVTAGSAFADIPRRGGCFESGMMAWAFAVSNHQMDAARMVRDDWDDVLQ
ncbi:MAG TPA: esterase, partial [Ruthenibacterium lactatiformans]|nr:esterase [Ruthenibacterium lactatiformans]